jgi:transposase
MNIRYRVELSQDDRDQVTALLSGGKHPARKIKRAQILLAADAGVGDEAIATSVSVGGSTVYRTKRRFVEGNLELALAEEARPGAGRKLTGREEALLVATACSNPPAGCARWTLELLAGEMVKLTEHAAMSRETVRRRLAEKQLKPRQKDMWCIPKVDGAYVARMEDVLDLYAEEGDPQYPVVCFDESPTQLIGEVREPITASPGQPERYDCAYRRNGTADLFVFLDAHKSWRHVKVTDHRAAADFAHWRPTLRTACAIWSIFTTHRPILSAWCWTICPRTVRARSTKPSRRTRRTGCSSAWSSITRRSMQVG